MTREILLKLATIKKIMFAFDECIDNIFARRIGAMADMFKIQDLCMFICV